MNIFFRLYLEVTLKKHATMSDSSSSPRPLCPQFPDQGKKGREQSPGMLWEEAGHKHPSRWHFPMRLPPPAVGFLWHDGNPIGQRCDTSPMAGSFVPLLRSLFPEEPYGTSSPATAGQGVVKIRQKGNKMLFVTCCRVGDGNFFHIF